MSASPSSTLTLDPDTPFRAGWAFRAFLLVLAWAPFPLGSNREWSWSVLTMLVSMCAFLWLLEHWRQASFARKPAGAASVALLIIVVVLVWTVVQTVSWVPSEWKNPLWNIAASALGQSLPGTISINPWRSQTAVMKFGTYIVAGLLAHGFSRDESRAYLLLRWIVIIGTAYAIYATALALGGYSQFEIFYSGPAPKFGPLSGPFVLKNSYATYAGLISLCALAAFWRSENHWISSASRKSTISVAMWRLIAERNALHGAAFFISFSTLVACASRAGFVSTVCAILAMLVLLALRRAGRSGHRGFYLVGATSLAVVLLVTISGRALDFRLAELAEAGFVDPLRLELWRGGLSMIHDRPLLGWGLDTFEDAYPLYAESVHAAVMDKAHEDYIELAAALGLPAAFAALASGSILAGLCLRGALADHPDWPYAALGFGATVLVSIHSFFDFSLQIPAIALLYVTIFGLGLARSRKTPTV